jgi:hypothetical protein
MSSNALISRLQRVLNTADGDLDLALDLALSRPAWHREYCGMAQTYATSGSWLNAVETFFSELTGNPIGQLP